MNVAAGVSLRPYNTLGVAVRAEWFARLTAAAQIPSLLARFGGSPILVLGGGSNLVLTSEVPGLVLHNAIGGLELLAEDGDGVSLRVGAGENWDQLVARCTGQGWFGLENLSWIPGSVGAAPIQNIGAYGVELKDTLLAVHTVGIEDAEPHRFSAADCRLGYRDSIFKHEQQDRQIITAVDLRLHKRPHLQLEYGEIRQTAERWGHDLKRLTPSQVRQLIIRIRQEKLPDPALAPNVGSFFKNPVVDAAQYQCLRQREPELVAFAQADGRYKLAAGWLIDRLGWKGRRLGQARVHPQQALVLVNEGHGSDDVLRLAQQIQRDVKAAYGVALEVEPRIVRGSSRLD
ncbi:MAG: UDP-N-acetylmuramate dehydrogenase [Pseudomonadota bacterium]|nr:UDP-N-acetylmuramate dehydrogenase [Pseudomonadota bacterium]